MSNPSPSPDTRVSAPRRVLLAPSARLALEHGGSPARVLLATGVDGAERAALERAFPAAALEPLGFPGAGLGAAHELVQRLRAALAPDAGLCVELAGHAAADLDARALAFALCVALHESAATIATAPGSAGRPAPELLAELRTRAERALAPGTPRATAVVSTWNKLADLRANLDGLRAQTLPFESIVVVDNASRDGTAEAVQREYPEVRLIVMPHSEYGACETFNIGFASSLSTCTAILDDDIVMPPAWLERASARLAAEPPSTAILSTQVVEPGTPESYLKSPRVNEERYMSTFRGCASLARTRALREAGGYDERLFIYGNERDLTCRLLNRGYRVLQYPGCGVFHKTPFGIKMGKRSLYYHARNAWISMLKYAPLSDLARMPFLVLFKVVLRGGKQEAAGEVSDATGTIGIGRSLRETPGAWWIVAKAALSVLWNLPYCIRHREPVRASDFELPLH